MKTCDFSIVLKIKKVTTEKNTHSHGVVEIKGIGDIKSIISNLK